MAAKIDPKPATVCMTASVLVTSMVASHALSMVKSPRDDAPET